MKAQNNPFLTITRVALAAAICMVASANAATNSWIIGDGDWDTTTDNWSAPTTWTNGDDAVFSNTASATSITLSSGLTAGSVVVGNGGNNANYTFTGGSLSAASFTLQGSGANGPDAVTSTLNNTSLTLTGDIGVGRATLVIGGNSTVTADRIGGGGMTGISSADWGQVTIQDTANVTATNGIVGGTVAWGLNLNGGTLTTKGINYNPLYTGVAVNLNFNGTLVKANQDNANFITVQVYQYFAADIQAGGAKIDTNGFDIGIGVALDGSGALTKSGNGTLTLTNHNGYSGGTTINGGTVIGGSGAATGGNTALGIAAPTNVVTINNGGVLTGTGVSNWLDSTGLSSNGSNAHTVVINTGGMLKGADGNITGLGNVTLNGGTIEVSNGLGLYGWSGSFTLGGDITVSGSTASAITTSSGAGGLANILMSNGSNGTGGTRTFTVNDVTSSAASDLVVSARLALGTVIKEGAGTLEIVAGETGTDNPATWEIAAGNFLVANGATFEFGVTNSTSNRVIEASGGNGSAAFNGTLNINTSAVTLTTGNSWSLIDVTGLGATFDPTTFSVASFDDSNNDGIWTKSDLIGNWSFSEATGELILAVGGSPYTTWAGGFPGFTPTTGTLDFENDGIPNLLEFVLGGNPTTNDSPSIRPTVSASGSDLVVTFNRTDLSETEPVEVKVQTSPDLVTWTDFATIGATSDIPSGYTVAENDAAADTIVVTIPKAAATKKFARVSAE